jgi:hypothetical protein
MVKTTYNPKYTPELDWEACLDGYEPGDPLGLGSTEQAAIEDLMSKMEDA